MSDAIQGYAHESRVILIHEPSVALAIGCLLLGSFLRCGWCFALSVIIEVSYQAGSAPRQSPIQPSHDPILNQPHAKQTSRHRNHNTIPPYRSRPASPRQQSTPPRRDPPAPSIPSNPQEITPSHRTPTTLIYRTFFAGSLNLIGYGNR